MAGFARRWRAFVTIALLALAAICGAAPPASAQTPAPAAPPQGRELVIGINQAPPFVLKSAEGRFHGISIDLWEHIAADLALRTRYVEVENADALIRGVESGAFDAGIAAVTVTAARARRIDFSQPYVSTGLGVAAPADGTGIWTSLQRIFLSFGFLQAVGTLVGLTIIVGMLVWLFERRANPRFERGPLGLGAGIWWSAIAMTQAGAARNAPRSLAGRVLAVVWMISSIITIAVFTAGVTSTLTRNAIQGVVQSESDLTNARVGVVAGFPWKAYLNRHHIRTRDYKTLDEGLRALRTGRLDAFIHDKPALQWLVRQDFASTVRILDTTPDQQSYAMVFPKGSAQRTRIDQALLTAVETDWWREILQQYLGE